MGLFNNLMHSLTGDQHELPLRLAPDGRLVAKGFQGGTRMPYVELEMLKARQAALDRVQAIAEFTPEGHFINANINFLETVGYALDEIKGWHHSRLVPVGISNTPDYSELWARLKRGQCHVHHCALRSSEGELCVAQIGYSPVFDARGIVVRVLALVTELPQAC